MKKENGKISMMMLIVMILVIFLIAGTLTIIKIEDYYKTKYEEQVTNLAEELYKEDDNDEEQNTVKYSELDYSFLQMENKGQNMIYSPLSIKYALKMLGEGASGNTYTQINNIVGDLTLTKYSNIEDVLSLANGLYIRDSFYDSVKTDYIVNLSSKYNAEVIEDSFESADNINNWIEEKTLGLIPSLLSNDQISDSTKMMLINALAITMDWEDEFDASDTNGRSFYLEDETEIEATTMYKKTSSDDVSYYIDDEITVLTMDLKEYDDVQLEFMAIMPNGDLSEYIEELTDEKINTITERLISAEDKKNGVEIYIPKFKFDYELNLQEDLENLGITDAFTEGADFSNMSDSDLYVSKAIHKATIDFSEKGIKAAAVTVFSMTTSAMEIEQKPVEVRIDKPFLFLIRDKETNEIWFTGTVYEPNLWEDDKEEYEESFYDDTYIDEGDEETTSMEESDED